MKKSQFVTNLVFIALAMFAFILAFTLPAYDYALTQDSELKLFYLIDDFLNYFYFFLVFAIAFVGLSLSGFSTDKRLRLIGCGVNFITFALTILIINDKITLVNNGNSNSESILYILREGTYLLVLFAIIIVVITIINLIMVAKDSAASNSNKKANAIKVKK